MTEKKKRGLLYLRNWKESVILLSCITGATVFPSTSYALDGNNVTSPIVYQQASYELSGAVVDDAGEALAGVNIAIKGKTRGTITDVNGKFTLNVSQGETLVVSFIGMITKEIKITGQRELNIELVADTQNLDEVVVVGFGTQKKVNLTGSVGVADAKALESRPVMTAAQALQGMVPGLQISQNMGGLEKRASMNIRGTATIGKGSSGSPLILIDGMEGDIDAINPQDIENISVLKDAAASSIYGARAPFGVILVTTKKGRVGKPTVNYNNSFRWSDPVLLPQMADSYTFATYFNDGCINGGYAPQFGEDQMQRIKDYQSGKLTTSVPVNPSNPNMWGDGYLYGNDNVDWYDAVYRNWVFSQEHNFSLNGGNEAVNYYLSMNYLDQNGMMKLDQDTYDRYSATAKICSVSRVEFTGWWSWQISNGLFVSTSTIGIGTY